MDLILPKLVVVVSHKHSTITLVSTLATFQNQFNSIESNFKSTYHYTPLIPLQDDQGGSFIYSKDRFFDMVDKSKEMIRSGDVFQILMTNRYIRNVIVDPFSFYRVLRIKNPSPYMYLME